MNKVHKILFNSMKYSLVEIKMKELFFIISLCISLAYTDLTINSVPNDTPIIFSKLGRAQLTYESIKLVYYADLKSFFGLKHNIKSAIDSVKKTHSLLNKPYYTSAAGQLEHQLQLLYADEDRLMSYRAKRFILCETCGKVNHFLFGVMDSETARGYDEAINNVSMAAIQNRNLIRNQSAVFEAALHFNRNVFGRYESEINALSQKSNNQSDKMVDIQLEITEQALIQVTQLLITEYYRIFGQIRRTMTDARSGKINELIPAEQLKRDLAKIELTLGSHQRLPIDADHENIMHIFNFVQMKSTLFAQKILVEITIPISEKEQFYVYKASPVPMEIEYVNFMPKIHSSHFLLNWDQTKYIPMSQKQLDNGKMMAQNEILYRPTATTLLSSENICE